MGLACQAWPTGAEKLGLEWPGDRSFTHRCRNSNTAFTVLISSITQLIESYGLVFVAMLICLESIALPVPGETVLILAAVFAGTRHQLNIIAVVLTAATAAFVGQAIGYMIGRQFGYRLLLQYGGYLPIT